MSRIAIAFFGAGLLAACQPGTDDERGNSGDEPTASQPAAATTPDVVATPVESLVGEYRVAKLNGEQISAPRGLALSVTGSVIVFDGACGEIVWEYTLEGLDLSTTRVREPQPCVHRVAPHYQIYALPGAIDNATNAARTPSNGIQLTGDRHSVTLYSQ